MDVKNEFLNISISKKNSEIVLLLSTAVLSEIILDKIYYNRNPDLKSFTVEILEKNYGDYLFNARPALFARAVKDLREHQKKNIEQFLKIERNIQKFLLKNLEKEKNNNHKPGDGKDKKVNSNQDVIDAWRAVIES